MKVNALHILFIGLLLLLPLSCKKNNDDEHSDTDPLAEAEALVIAAAQSVELERMETDATTIVFHLSTPFQYKVTGKIYTSVSISQAALSKVEDTASSCRLTFKDGKSCEFFYYTDLSISLEPVVEYLDYKGNTRNFEFAFYKTGKGNFTLAASAEGEGKAAVTYDKATNHGVFSVTLNDDYHAVVKATLTISGPHSDRKYSVTASALYCDIKAEDEVTLGTEIGSSKRVAYSIDTNLDGYAITAEISDTEYFGLENVAVDGLTVKTVAENHSGEDIKATISVHEASGDFSTTEIVVILPTLPPLPV